MITKKLLPSKDAYLQFTEDELLEFGIKEGDKFEVKYQDGGILLEKYKEIEFDIDDFDIQTLKMMVLRSFQEDKTCNQVLIDVLEEYMDNNPVDDELVEDLTYASKDLFTFFGVNSAEYVLPTGVNYIDTANPLDKIND